MSYLHNRRYRVIKKNLQRIETFCYFLPYLTMPKVAQEHNTGQNIAQYFVYNKNY